MNEALADEIVDAYNNTGGVVKKRRSSPHGSSHRAFAHLRWYDLLRQSSDAPPLVLFQSYLFYVRYS